MPGPTDELVFAPLGGVGEIGMNLALYGFGPEQDRSWIVGDMGSALAGDEVAGQSPGTSAHPCARGPFWRAPRSLAAAQDSGPCNPFHGRAPRGQKGRG